MSGKALMTQYTEGALIGRELQEMMADYAASAHFDREMTDDIDLYNDRKYAEKHSGDKDNEPDEI